MRERLIAATATAMMLAACSTSTPTTTDEAPTSSLPATAAPSESAVTTTAPDPDTDTSNPAEPAPSSETPTVLADSGQDSSVEVSSSAVPADVAKALRGNGGELVDTEDWTNRIDTLGLPVLTGPGISLVEATLEATNTASGWERLDELQWLFTTPTPRDDLLDQLAFAAGIAAVEPSTDNSTVDSADCTIRTYDDPATSTTWDLQGCTFPTFENMTSIGISRTAYVSDANGPTPLDPSIAAVLDDLDATGHVADVTATFGAPTPGSTSTLTMATTIEPDDADPATALSSGALSTWNRTDGEAGLVVFAGSPGTTWTVTNGTVRFTHEGRLAP